MDRNTALQTTFVEQSAPDRSQLKRVQARFERLAKQRFLRLKSVLLPAQRQFLDILPALLHCHHPVLPGYGKRHTVSGIHHYRIRSDIRQLLERRFPGFKPADAHLQSLSIQGLYLMGSSGTLAQSIHSDLDCWVCLNQAPDQETKEALLEKCTEISNWAKRFRLEVHFFIMHDESFQQKLRADMSVEDCGGTQHYLLLDEFYRTAIPLAGRSPLWWLTPCETKLDRDSAEQNDFYQSFRKTLLDNRFIKQQKYLDFGDTGVIPIREYLSASVWTLYKAIQSPNKALIKLMLLESYIVEHGTKHNLSDQLKIYLHGEQDDLESLDPYLQVYQHVEQYLTKTNQVTRLDVLRRCFYRKIDIKISRLSPSLLKKIDSNKDNQSQNKRRSPEHAGQPSLWRHQLLLEIVNEWGWSKERLRHEDNINHWPLDEQLQERRDIDRELIAIYQFLDHTAQQQLTQKEYQAHRNSEEMRLLERQLRVVFRHRRFKTGYRVAEIDTRLIKQPANNLFLSSNRGNRVAASNNTVSKKGWTLLSSEATDDQQSVIYSAHTLEQMILWSALNGLANKKTIFTLNRIEDGNQPPKSNNSDLSTDRIARHVFGFISQEFSSDAAIRQLDISSEVTRCMVLINSLPNESGNDLLDKVVLSERDDPLSYTGMPHNMVQQLSMTWENNWGEIFHRQFVGHSALQDALDFYHKLNRSRYCQPEFHCISNERSAAVTKRVQQLFKDSIDWLEYNDSPKTDGKPRAFAFATADGLYLVVAEKTSSEESTPNFWPLHGPATQALEDIASQWSILLDPISISSQEHFPAGAKSLLG